MAHTEGAAAPLAGGRRGKECAASLRAEQRLAVGGLQGSPDPDLVSSPDPDFLSSPDPKLTSSLDPVASTGLCKSRRPLDGDGHRVVFIIALSDPMKGTRSRWPTS